MKSVKKIIIFIHILALAMVFRMTAFGQVNSVELTCRAQAKEVALQSYQGCVTEARQTQIDTLRKEYSDKLSELKEHYNKELKKAAGKEEAIDTSKPPVKKSSQNTSEKPARTIAKTLPAKNGGVSIAPVDTQEVSVIPVEEEAN